MPPINSIYPYSSFWIITVNEKNNIDTITTMTDVLNSPKYLSEFLKILWKLYIKHTINRMALAVKNIEYIILLPRSFGHWTSSSSPDKSWERKVSVNICYSEMIVLSRKPSRSNFTNPYPIRVYNFNCTDSP